jgi:hypothetical protein
VNRRGLAAALLALLLPGCAAIPPAAIGGIAGAAAAAFRLDDDILKLVIAPGASSPVKGPRMSVLTLPTNLTATIPLLFTNQVGLPIAAPAGGSVSVDNTAVATAALTADGSSITATPVADGTANLSYTNGALSATLAINVVTPAASSVSFGQASFAAP